MTDAEAFVFLMELRGYRPTEEGGWRLVGPELITGDQLVAILSGKEPGQDTLSVVQENLELRKGGQP